VKDKREILLIGKYGQSKIPTGPEKVANNLFAQLQKAYPNVKFISYFFKTMEQTNIYKRLFGCELISRKIFCMGWLRMLIYVLIIQPDVVHFVNFERFVTPLFFVKPFLKSKFVVIIHGLVKNEDSHANGRWKDLYLERTIFKKADKLIFPSRLHLQRCAEQYKFNEEKTTVIPNGIEAEFYSPDRKNIIEGSLKIVFFGGGSAIDRGFEKVIRILDKAKDSQIELFVIGADLSLNFNSAHLKIINQPMIERSDFIQFLSDKNLVMLLSEYESFSIFGAECMSAGVIPVINKNVGLSEHIENGINGFIVDVSEPDKITALINQIFNSEFGLNRISADSSEINYKLSWDKIAERYMNVYFN